MSTSFRLVLVFLFVLPSSALALGEFDCRSTDGSIAVSDSTLTIHELSHDLSHDLSHEFSSIRRQNASLHNQTEGSTGMLRANTESVYVFQSSRAFFRVINIRSERLLSEQVNECSIDQPQCRGLVFETHEKIIEAEIAVTANSDISGQAIPATNKRTVTLGCEESRAYGGRCQ